LGGEFLYQLNNYYFLKKDLLHGVSNLIGKRLIGHKTASPTSWTSTFQLVFR